MLVTRGVRASFVSIVSAVSLIAGLVTSAGEVERPDSNEFLVSVSDLPVPSPVLPLESAVPETPTGDFTGAEELVTSMQPSVSVGKALSLSTGFKPFRVDPESLDFDALDEVERSEFGTVYQVSDGLFVASASPTPVHARNDEGEWVPISTTLSEGADGTLSASAHPLDPSFGARADDESLFAVSRDGFDVSFELVGAASSESRTDQSLRRTAQKSAVTYRDVFDGVDLLYEVETGGVKEHVVLRELPSPEAAEFTWGSVLNFVFAGWRDVAALGRDERDDHAWQTNCRSFGT